MSQAAAQTVDLSWLELLPPKHLKPLCEEKGLGKSGNREALARRLRANDGLTVVQLKGLCETVGVTKQGNKADLARRIGDKLRSKAAATTPPRNSNSRQRPSSPTTTGQLNLEENPCSFYGKKELHKIVDGLHGPIEELKLPEGGGAIKILRPSSTNITIKAVGPGAHVWTFYYYEYPHQNVLICRYGQEQKGGRDNIKSWITETLSSTAAGDQGGQTMAEIWRDVAGGGDRGGARP